MNIVLNKPPPRSRNMSASDEVGKIFVGGIDNDTRSEQFQEYFAKYGELVDCILMVDDTTGKNRGFGFVKYKDPSCVEVVLSSGPHVLNGKQVDAKQCTPRDASRKSRDFNNRSGGPGGDGEYKIFVGGVPQNVDENDLKNFFQAYGKVSNSQLMKDKTTDRSRGFGFITFETQEPVNRLCKQHFVEINGKKVECKPAEDRFKSGGRGNFSQPNQGGWSGPQGGMGYNQGNWNNQNQGYSYPPQQGWGPPPQQQMGNYPQQNNYGGPPQGGPPPRAAGPPAGGYGGGYGGPPNNGAYSSGPQGGYGGGPGPYGQPNTYGGNQSYGGNQNYGGQNFGGGYGGGGNPPADPYGPSGAGGYGNQGPMGGDFPGNASGYGPQRGYFNNQGPGNFGSDMSNSYGGGPRTNYNQGEDMYGAGGPMGGNYQRAGNAAQYHPYRR